MFYLQMNALLHTIKTIALPSFSRHKLKLLSKCCVFKVRQYILTSKVDRFANLFRDERLTLLNSNAQIKVKKSRTEKQISN